MLRNWNKTGDNDGVQKDMGIGKVVFRADASTQIGSGHIMRCLTLAAGLKNIGTEVSFICRSVEGNLCDVVHSKGFPVYKLTTTKKDDFDINRDMVQTIGILQEIGSVDWLIIDHYGIDKNWQQNMRPYTKHIMVIDDLANRNHECDLLLDQTFGENASRYSSLVPSTCKTLIGTKYALLRGQFRRYKKPKIPNFHHDHFMIHVFFGGADPANYTFRYSKLLLEHFSYLKLKVVVGKQYRYSQTLVELATVYPDRLEWKQDVSNMADHMSECDAALGAPGTTTWERACLGLPSAYLTTANNQTKIVEKLDQKGLCVYMGNAAAIKDAEFINKFTSFISNHEKLVNLYRTCVTNVDGFGVERVISNLMNKKRSMVMNQNVLSYNQVKLLPYGKEHDQKTIQWLNDPSVAAAFGLTKRISLDSHRKWLESQSNYYIWAIYDHEQEHRGNVSLTYNPKHHSTYFQIYIGDNQARGRGLGYSSLVCAMKFAFETLQTHRLWLHVFPENLAAIHLYQKVGFQQEGTEREAHFFNGTYRDQLRYSLLNAEWEKRQGEEK